MTTLYAICGDSSNFAVKLVQLATAVQSDVATVFASQEQSFFNGINTFIPFTGDWTPNDNELLSVTGNQQAALVVAACKANAISLPVIRVNNFNNEDIRALAVVRGSGAGRKLLIQSFSPQQILSNKIAFISDGHVFNRLSKPAFSLDTKLVATIHANGDLLFKSYNLCRRIFDLSAIYRSATDAEIQAFCNLSKISVNNVSDFINNADEGIRKALHLITKSNVLGTHSVATIASRAAVIGFTINTASGKIKVPQDRKGAKELFSFLLNKVYKGPIDQTLFITNSTRPL